MLVTPMQKKWFVLILASSVFSGVCIAQPRQDTLRLPLSGAEKTFLDSNLQLLANRYNIDASKALVIQARLWPNPNLSVGHTLYSGSLKKFFPTGANDET